MDKRGQVTIFIIIAIAVVGIAAGVYYFVPGIGTTGGSVDQNPEAFIEQCLEDDLQDVVETISLQGGSMEPEHYFTYNGVDIEYLCYNSEYYLPCKIQRPFLSEHIESEIKNAISDEAESCFNQLEQNYDERGYETDLILRDFKVSILPNRIDVTFDHTFTITKGETDRYESFDVILNNNLYELISISNDIIDWEAVYGDFETTYYKTLYSEIDVDKYNQLDGSTIYVLSERDSGDKFQFASRSVAWPPGYGEVSNFEG